MQYLKAFSISPSIHYTLASKGSREVANLTETQNLLTTVYGVKKIVCLSVTNSDLNYLRTGEKNQLNFFWDIYVKKCCPNFFSHQGAVKAWGEGQKANLLSKYRRSTRISTSPRATKQGRIKCRCHVPFQRSQHREQSWRRADTKKICFYYLVIPFNFHLKKLFKLMN